MRLVIVFLMLGLCASVVVAAPGGDEGNIPIGKQFKWPPGWFADRDTYAEQEPNDPCGSDQAILCMDVIDPGCIDYLGDRDWYVFTANAGDEITCGTDFASGGLPGFDSYIELYADDCTTQLAYDDDSGPGTYSLISGFIAPYTGAYHLMVRAYGDYYTGCYMAFVDCNIPPPPPDNDTCEGAEATGYFFAAAQRARPTATPMMPPTTTARQTTAPATPHTETMSSTTWIWRQATLSHSPTRN